MSDLVPLDDPDCCVLFVAEKPSVALAIASALSRGNHRTRGLRPLVTHDTFAYFGPAKRRCAVRVTSVLGHIHGLDFDAGTGSRDLRSVFTQRTRKVVEETSASADVCGHLRRSADGCGWLCLWLDCVQPANELGTFAPADTQLCQRPEFDPRLVQAIVRARAFASRCSRCSARASRPHLSVCGARASRL
jgi:hypothetical protein